MGSYATWEYGTYCLLLLYPMGNIDINCDLGEGLKNDHLLMPYLDSCNIACGGHAGNRESILATLSLAQKYEVKAGAHPSYPDPLNFGRELMHIPEAELYASLLEQLQLFQACCEEMGLKVNHIKLHGALYNHASRDIETADLVCHVLSRNFPDIAIYGQSGSALSKLAKEYNIPFLNEVFADRTYEADGSLVSRHKPHSVLTNPDIVIRHVLEMVRFQRIIAVDGTSFPVKADTLCVHGDNPNAVAILKAIRTHV